MPTPFDRTVSRRRTSRRAAPPSRRAGPDLSGHPHDDAGLLARSATLRARWARIAHLAHQLTGHGTAGNGQPVDQP